MAAMQGRCVTLILLLVSVLVPLCRADRVAIIGGGLGGAAAAYFLHKADPHAEIHLFERGSALGGRLREIDFEGKSVDLGRFVFHELNKLSSSLVGELGLETTIPQELNGTYGIFDGHAQSIVYREGANDTNTDDWRRFFKYFTRYTLNIRSVKFNIKHYLNKWVALLDDPPFEDVPDLLDMLDMTEKATYSLATDLADFIGFYTLRDFGAAATRFVVGQNPPIVNSVAGHFALATSRSCRTDQLWTVKGGAQALLQKLVEQSQAKVHLGYNVTKIEKSGERYKVHHKVDGKTASQPFDVVFLSAPYHSDELELPDGVEVEPEIEWLDEEVILIKGRLNQTFFGLKANETFPDVIGTVDTVYFPVQAIRTLWTFPDGEQAYKVTMAEQLTDEMLHDYFSSVTTIERITVDSAWPDLTFKGRNAKYPAIQLNGKTLLYPGAIESVVTGLEPIIISAWNAVRLLSEPKEGESLGGEIEESVVAIDEATERVATGKVPEHVLGNTQESQTGEVTVDRTEL